MRNMALARWLLALSVAGLGYLFVAGAACAAVERVVSPGGIEAWLIEDHTNPLISLAIGFRGGSALDPVGKEGMAFLASGLMNEGAGDLDSTAFQAKLADLAIDFSFDADADSVVGRLRMLTAHRDEAFDLLHVALTRPRVDAEPLLRVRNQVLSIIASEASSPDDVAGKAWFRMMLADHPYARPAKGTAKSLAAITATDLRKFAAHEFTRDRILIGVVGDISPADLARLLDRTFGDLPAHGASSALSEAPPPGPGGIAVMGRNLDQSVVLFGEAGIKRSDPDFYAAALLDDIIGGGDFSSRLTRDLRIKRGLVYTIATDLLTLDHVGLLSGSFATKNASAGEAIELTRAEWKRMGEAGPTEAELADAKTHLIGSYPLRFDSTLQAADVLLGIQLAGLAIDYVDKRAGYFQAVSLADARRVARRLYHAEDLRFLVLGRPVAVTGTLPVPPAP
jgi:zinc protease